MMPYQICSIAKIFKVLCFIGVLIMVGYWLYKFEIEDRDIGVVDYEILEKVDVEYPVLSLCFKNPFIERELNKFIVNGSQKLDKSSYEQYLKGENIDDKIMKSIMYENVTIDLDNYFSYAIYKFRNESSSHVITSSKLISHKITFNGYFRHQLFVKCFAPEISKSDYPNLERFELSYDTDSLLDDLAISERGFQRVDFNIHYPEHFLLEVSRGSGLLSDLLRFGKTSGTRLSITEIEFLKRRRNRNNDCLENWKNFDSLVLRQHVKKFGCQLPYILPTRSEITKGADYPICESAEQMETSMYDFYKAKNDYYPKACHRISRLNYFIQSPPANKKWSIVILYPEEIKIITQSKEVDVHSLIGNIGGYIGLFLGWALIQIPDLLLSIYIYVKTRSKEVNLIKLEKQDTGINGTPIRKKSNCGTQEINRSESKHYSQDSLNEGLKGNHGDINQGLYNDLRFKGLEEDVHQLKEEFRKFVKDFKSEMKIQ